MQYLCPQKHTENIVNLVLNNVVMTSKNLLGLKDLEGLPLLCSGLPNFKKKSGILFA